MIYHIILMGAVTFTVLNFERTSLRTVVSLELVSFLENDFNVFKNNLYNPILGRFLIWLLVIDTGIELGEYDFKCTLLGVFLQLLKGMFLIMSTCGMTWTYIACSGLGMRKIQ